MRQPSVHLTKSSFNQLLEELEVKAFPVDAFFRMAASRAIISRNLVVKNKKITKKVNKVLLATKGDTQLTADLIYAVRIKLRHRGVRKITEANSREWSLCKELTSICNQFRETYNFDNTREAFITYIELGFKKMQGNYRNWLTRLIAMSENVFNYYESLGALSEDDDFKATQVLYDAYYRKIADATGILETKELSEAPEEHVHFLHLRKFLEEHGWDPEEYLEAQFQELAWCGAIPEYSKLTEDKAIKRYRAYLYKNGINRPQSSDPQVKGSLWDLMKQKR